MGGGCEQQLGVGGFKIEAHEASRKVILNADLLKAVVPSEPCCRQQPARVRQPCPPRIPVQLTFALLRSWHLPYSSREDWASNGKGFSRVGPETLLASDVPCYPRHATSLSLGSVLDTSKSGEFGGLPQF